MSQNHGSIHDHPVNCHRGKNCMKAAVITCGIYLFNRSSHKILICHATNSPWNRWSIPKGLKDPGEDSLHAAIRELEEETGILFSALGNVKTFPLTPAKYQKQNKILEPFLLTVDDVSDTHSYKSNLVEGKDFPEIDKWKWVTLAEAAGLVHETQVVNLERIRELTKS